MNCTSMATIRIALAQFDFPVAAISENADRIVALAERARDELGARLIVFPELTLSGYLAEDLILRPSFIKTATNISPRSPSACAAST